MSSCKTAKYYTYRNLNRGTSFSTKYKGVVAQRSEVARIPNGEFKVSDAGRERCLARKKRNVHAFVVSDAPPVKISRAKLPNMTALTEVKYNPYVRGAFFTPHNGASISNADEIYLFDGKCYVSNT